jgi:hypothetical protein
MGDADGSSEDQNADENLDSKDCTSVNSDENEDSIRN